MRGAQSDSGSVTRFTCACPFITVYGSPESVAPKRTHARAHHTCARTLSEGNSVCEVRAQCNDISTAPVLCPFPSYLTIDREACLPSVAVDVSVQFSRLDIPRLPLPLVNAGGCPFGMARACARDRGGGSAIARGKVGRLVPGF